MTATVCQPTILRHEYLLWMLQTSITPGGTSGSVAAATAALPTASTLTGGTKGAPTMGVADSDLVGSILSTCERRVTVGALIQATTTRIAHWSVVCVFFLWQAHTGRRCTARETIAQPPTTISPTLPHTHTYPPTRAHQHPPTNTPTHAPLPKVHRQAPVAVAAHSRAGCHR